MKINRRDKKWIISTIDKNENPVNNLEKKFVDFSVFCVFYWFWRDEPQKTASVGHEIGETVQLVPFRGNELLFLEEERQTSHLHSERKKNAQFRSDFLKSRFLPRKFAEIHFERVEELGPQEVGLRGLRVVRERRTRRKTIATRILSRIIGLYRDFDFLHQKFVFGFFHALYASGTADLGPFRIYNSRSAEKRLGKNFEKFLNFFLRGM